MKLPFRKHSPAQEQPLLTVGKVTQQPPSLSKSSNSSSSPVVESRKAPEPFSFQLKSGSWRDQQAAPQQEKTSAAVAAAAQQKQEQVSIASSQSVASSEKSPVSPQSITRRKEQQLFQDKLDASERLVVLITGATQGLGYATAQALAATGNYHVLIGARSPIKAAQAIKSLTSDTLIPLPESCLSPLTIDLTSDASINMAVLYVQSHFGRLDILINNAGTSPRACMRPSLREQYFELFNANLFGTAVITQSFLPLLRASKATGRKRIVNVSSGMGSLAWTDDPANPFNSDKVAGHIYRASKAALNMLTVVDSEQLRKDGIEVVSVCPGHLNTAFNGHKGLKEASEGAKTVVRAATQEGVGGRFLTDEMPEGCFPW